MEGDDDETGWTEFYETVRGHIDEAGYHLTYVGADPPFCYSVGLSATWDHPELLLFGLGFEDSKTILMALAREIGEGQRFVHGSIDDETFNRSVAFVEIPKDEYPGRFNVTIDVYDGMDFEALQVVTPDRTGRVPWDGDSIPDPASSQPLLGHFPGGQAS
jgi:hypothetical protein